MLLLVVSRNWKGRKSMNLNIMVFALLHNFALITDVLSLNAIFVIKMTTDSMKLYITKTASMMTIKRD